MFASILRSVKPGTITARMVAYNPIVPRIMVTSMITRNFSMTLCFSALPRLPISGYDTLEQRLAFPQKTQSYYFNRDVAKRQRDGDFVDIHDGIPIGVEDYDFLITDIGQKELSHEISQIFGIRYLSDVDRADFARVVQRVSGMIWGRNRRCLLSLTARLEGNAKWVHFLLDTGSPRTYISQQAADALGVVSTDMETPIHIGGHLVPVLVSPQNSHFSEVNVIGMDYIALHNIATFLDSKRRAFTFYYGFAGKVPELFPKV